MKHTQSRQTGIRILMLAVAAIMLASAAPCLGQSSPDHVPNQLIVTLQPGSNIATARQVASAHGMQVAKKLPLADTYLLEWDPSQGYDIHGKITELKGAGAVIAEPNAYCKFDAVPNDSLYGDLWGMEMINMPAAWDIEKGKDSVIVAVIDTAFYLRFDYDDGSSSFFMHPDIKDRLLPGYDFGNNDDDPSMPFPNQSCATHGLHVAGTIAATTDNNEGVAGVCWEGVKILPIKVIDDASIAPNGDCTFTITSAIEGLDYAMRNGAKVVNNSWGVIGGRSVEVDSLRAKIRELLDAGIIVVASAGNSGYSSDPSVGLPAAFDGVIAVSAVGPDEALAYYSSYGREVDIAAPGGDMSVGGEEGGIRSTTIWTVKDLDGEDVGVWGYLWWQGTSMASPHVAGAAALLLSLGVPAANVPYYLTSSAKPAGEGRPNDQFGWGILDVHAALQMAAEIKVVEPSGSGNVYTGLPFFTVKTKVIEKSSIKVYIGTNVDLDMDGIPDDRATPLINSTNIDNYYDDESRQLSFQLVEEDPNNLGQAITYPIQPQNPLIIPQALEAGPHRICIIGDIFGSTTGNQVKTIKVFSVVPKIIPAGISLMSVPYALANGDGNPLTEEDP
ncbi:MAG: S8 family serine peptidase, partial [Armatimonadota bacterium]|nr:S8 family serine peptidase [Armatimonadota bacterium]